LFSNRSGPLEPVMFAWPDNTPSGKTPTFQFISYSTSSVPSYKHLFCSYKFKWRPAYVR